MMSFPTVRPFEAMIIQANASETEIRGQTAGQGVECPLFRLDDGEVITLSGDAPSGDGVWVLTGFWMDASHCMQGRTFRISDFRKFNGD